MRLGLNIGLVGSNIKSLMPLIKEAEELGFHSVWTAEAYGSDAVTPLTWIAANTERIKVGSAIMQMPARTPAMTAMTCATLDILSEGRMLLGLGLSGPQVVEGWHGQPFSQPLERTREYVDIVRTILRRESRLEHHGDCYNIPYAGPDATGLGKPLKLLLHPLRPDVPIYIAALGPKNVELAAEIADGWLPVFFSPYKPDVYMNSVNAGFEAAKKHSGATKTLSDFDIAPIVPVFVGDDVTACRNQAKPFLAHYIGLMGTRDKNFYKVLATRYGYGEAADQIQDLALAGDKDAATAAVPDELVDEIALCGPKSRIAERLEIWLKSGITTLVVSTYDPTAIRVLAELVPTDQ